MRTFRPFKLGDHEGYMCTPSSPPPSATVSMIFFITSACLERKRGKTTSSQPPWDQRTVCVPHLQGWTEHMAGGGRWGWFSMVTVFFTWSWLMSSYIWSTLRGCRSWRTTDHQRTMNTSVQGNKSKQTLRVLKGLYWSYQTLLVIKDSTGPIRLYWSYQTLLVPLVLSDSAGPIRLCWSYQTTSPAGPIRLCWS